MSPHPRPAAVPLRTAVPAFRRWAGIDPGASVGLVCLLVPNTGRNACDIDHARLVGIAGAAATGAKGYTRAGARGTMLLRVRQQLVDWRVTDVAMEEPNTAAASWRGAQGQNGKQQQTGTGFFLGAHFGLCLGAVVTMPWPVRVWSYPPTTSAKARRDPEATELLGWMQGRQGRPMKREDTLRGMEQLLRALKKRPADGVLPTLSEQTKQHTDHVYMALGVLNFHLLRERGRV